MGGRRLARQALPSKIRIPRPQMFHFQEICMKVNSESISG
jgi:hypothetical protein